MTDPLLHISDLSVELGGRLALNNVSLVVNRGQYIGLLGPNGGGKTTLLRTVLGAIKPLFGDIKIANLLPRQAALLGLIGYVPQRLDSFESNLPITVWELLKNAKYLCPRAALASLETLIERLRLGFLLNRLLGELSGGERQRVLIARALLSDPALLLLDEPTTGIDAESEGEFYSLLKSIHADGVTIILCSHNTDAVIREATHVVALQQHIMAVCSTSSADCRHVIGKLHSEHFYSVHHGHACIR